MKIRNILSKIMLKLLVRINAPLENGSLLRPDMPDEFYLDETACFEIVGTPSSIAFPRWMQIVHCEDKRSSLILVSGESFRINYPIKVEKDTRLFIRYSAALANISSDGLICEIYFHQLDRNNPAIPICSLPVLGGVQPPWWRVIDLDLSFLNHLSGYLVLRCQPGQDNNPIGDWLAISDLCVGREDRLCILRARSFHNLRAQNEIEHFSSVYRHSMYSAVQNLRAEMAEGVSRPVRKLMSTNTPVGSKTLNNIVRDVEPLSNETPYEYASRMLASSLPKVPPDFIARLKSRAEKGGVVKVLSLCSGAARIEASYAVQVGPNVKWSLLDINVDLLDMASKQFSPTVDLDLIEANVNDLEYHGEKWDVILCISALHHIVELERVVKFCHDSLNEDGEFWSIGEYVGRNGNRLWPEARVEANKIFCEFPERLRLNRHTGKIDHEIPDNDYSVGCFEGIRSEEIESVLGRWFTPEDVYHRNCFLWRLINIAYCDNYKIENNYDRKFVVDMVNAEVDYFHSGGRGTELFGVYRPRMTNKLSSVLDN